jgi:hypothetical protein
MNKVRELLKWQLVDEAGGYPICPISGVLAVELHEVITWPFRDVGDKYGFKIRNPERWAYLSKFYYVPELCVMVSPEANLMKANSMRDQLLLHQMKKYGQERVVKALRDLAQFIVIPPSYIPVKIDDIVILTDWK